MGVKLHSHVSVEVLEKELQVVKSELIEQLNIREKELKEYQDLQKRYTMLEKRYAAISRSVLGKLTLNYWTLRKRMGTNKATKGHR
jgi:hypothetical protein